jgi:hypothetical protein
VSFIASLLFRGGKDKKREPEKYEIKLKLKSKLKILSGQNIMDPKEIQSRKSGH